jgi:hypothetical protein
VTELDTLRLYLNFSANFADYSDDTESNADKGESSLHRPS